MFHCICKPLRKEHLLQGISCKKNQGGIYVGTCGAGGSIAVALQLNEGEDEQEGEASEDRQMGGGPVQKPVRVFLLPIVATDEASVSGFISA